MLWLPHIVPAAALPSSFGSWFWDSEKRCIWKSHTVQAFCADVKHQEISWELQLTWEWSTISNSMFRTHGVLWPWIVSSFVVSGRGRGRMMMWMQVGFSEHVGMSVGYSVMCKCVYIHLLLSRNWELHQIRLHTGYRNCECCLEDAFNFTSTSSNSIQSTVV